MPIFIDALETPVPVVDLDLLARNLDRMAAYAVLHGFDLRPHVKTHKSPRIAAEQMRLGAAGLTCATPRELEVMSDVSEDLFLAYPPVGPAKLQRLMALDRQVRLTVALDSAAAVEALAEAARASARTVRVLVEVDLGMRRVGVGTPSEAIALAELVDRRPPLEYAGVAFYPGHIREPVAEQGTKVAQLRRDLGALIAALDRAGYAPPTVSGGSTPLAWRMHEVEGVTEVRPGTYVFNDRATVDTGACALEDCALTVLATVVSVAVPGQAVIDAGSKALAREPAGGAPEEGYGILLERPEVRVRRMSEEHGILDLGDTDWRPAVGERVRVVPNHVCAAVHLFDTLHGVRNEVVETSWPVAARGRAAGEVSRAF